MTITLTKELQSILPPSVRRKAGFRAGDQVEIKASGGIVHIIPKLPTAEDEYTPEQRRVIDAQIAEGLDDLRKGRVSPRFDTVDEMLASLKSARKSARRQKLEPDHVATHGSFQRGLLQRTLSCAESL